MSAYVGQEVVLFIPEAGRLPYIFLPTGRRSVLGRGDTRSPQQPDVDLSLYGAVEHGVSRLHAAIDCGSDAATLTDLGSSNGTFLNSERLAANQSYILRDRDEIRLGRLTIHILFGTGQDGEKPQP